ncbi:MULTISPECIES: adenosylcobinamide-GDP ribazoletransferase [Nocardiaceae]|uniref:adenosylcobinamide-GDP ribazoletransferase n=1 Tax=Nocardiaceae TaxID=85025 RepID=UPI000522F575|nr:MULTISPECIES: adenosylcobinamide-GDP ribazoletransferase [Rhodococcus]OZC61391.1 adenosylcobinamide-GDP ribazoletransferase [Rhodococcus sp. 06-621-2]OZD13176.1 adenosylcobinamide-GDP ribazoletransferase [Rhodococcus sp. 06-156-4C]OZD16228.1 adenosylcobinamide-GDP ribazoletransferase [Rhodococcus sp. 06-156-3C]OZD17582.1 adenosylcobinamide-GDP ribazoletransferase [Rhodococcus sp. 06-156-4a]OZD34645.1 adenosylcobinamide-GDP ribazoletransferase [Rhodococcus sp. 06-156-3b]
MLIGPRLALSWLTVVPVRGPETVGRDDARAAIGWTPLVGVGLGVSAAAVLWIGVVAASLPAVLAGALGVVALALLTRGMHIDGLADTADGLGCYGPPERAREVMRSGSAGPFGVAAIGLVMLVQAAGFGALASAEQWWSVVVAVAAGRVAVVLACRRGVRPASDTGFGALVADSQSRVVVSTWAVLAVAASTLAVDGRWWQGPLVLVIALGAAALGVRHCVRRFGGVSGDVLGAAVETTTTIVVVGLLAGLPSA